MIHPLQDLRREREEARAAADPCTDLCCLATVADDGSPRLRTLVLREVTDLSVAVFCSRTSPKAHQLLSNGACELLIFWPTIRSQYRVRGPVEEIEVEEIRRNWERRPWESKLLDHLYASDHPQSSEIASRDALEAEVERLRELYPDTDSLPFPEGPTGFRVLASQVEIWRESADRIHDRRCYSLEGADWREQVLVP